MVSREDAKIRKDAKLTTDYGLRTNMIKSMTGFGQGSAEGDNFRVRVDIRSVNNRAIDVHTRLPQELSSLEVTLKKQVQSAVKRGRVDVTVSVEQLKPATFEINRQLVSGAVAALSQALKSLIEMRVVEGQELAAELTSRLDNIERQMPAIENEAARLPAVYREKLMKRLEEVVAGGQVDETRIAQEAVMLADRSDISEEIARLKSHVAQMRDLLRSTDEAGKRLDFILQEMNREANTILSKSNDLAISDAAIVIKTEVEKLREQGQNVE